MVTASLDGRSFAPVPLMRKERTADGREVVREVPPSEYRALRWSIGTLAAKESRAVAARARVSPLQVAALTSRYSERRIRIVDMIGRRGRFLRHHRRQSEHQRKQNSE